MRRKIFQLGQGVVCLVAGVFVLWNAGGASAVLLGLVVSIAVAGVAVLVSRRRPDVTR
jgi:uncharacterized membrane protein HdeD (DUF308 family)